MPLGPKNQTDKDNQTDDTASGFVINRYLLRCEALLSSEEIYFPLPQDYPRKTTRPCNNEMALWHADKALELATASNDQQGVAKAHLSRGKCFQRRGAWKDAHRCYVRAASLGTFARKKGEEGLEKRTSLCQRKMAARRQDIPGSKGRLPPRV